MSFYEKSFDGYNSKIISNAREKIKDLKNQLEEEITATLQKRYKGKILQCTCFDSWTDGDDYYLNQELIDIKAQQHADEDRFYIVVSFMYKSCCAPKTEPPKLTTFYLKSMERVNGKEVLT
jgi:hypothetical protein